MESASTSPVRPRQLDRFLGRPPGSSRPAIPSLARLLPDAAAFDGLAVQGLDLPPATSLPLRQQPNLRRDPVLALVHRITQGFRQDEYERARAMGYEAYLEEQLDPLAIDDSAMDARLAGYTTLEGSPRFLFDTYAQDATEPYLQFKSAVVLRSVHSKRQLLERMVEFWNDHFCIDHNKGDLEWTMLPEHDRLVIRPNALGSFPALLSGVAHGAAMLFYLDNWLNVRHGPQENYARELLELHTLGLHGGYTEIDVKEVAKCFTGWTLGEDLRATFVGPEHHGSSKLVLGHVIPALPADQNAQRVLDILAVHPSTARFLATKLIRWFLMPEPPAALVERVAATYLATNGDIKAMLREILSRENSRIAPPFRPKFRRPAHLVVSLLRTLDADVSDALYPLSFLYTMGHVPFNHVQPDGYPDTVGTWGNSLLGRWRFASELLQSAASDGFPWPGVALSRAAIATRLDFAGNSDRAGLAARINARLLGRALPPDEEQVLQDFIDSAPGTFINRTLLETIALGASLPGYQWY